jgi:hypothetical protein
MARELLGVAALCAVALTASASQGADTLAWHLSDEDVRMKLAYGQADTDNVGLILRCHPGTGIVYLRWPLDEAAGVGRPYGAKWSSEIRLASGRKNERLAVEVENGDSGPEATADPSAYGPVMKAFAKTGRISVDGTAQHAQTSGERRAIRQFMDLCYEVPD